VSSDLLSQIIDSDSLRSVYQPIVDLYDHSVVGYEALVRGPEGPMESPAQLFGTAALEGRLVELDHAARSTAVRGALRAGMRAPCALFVNVEPQSLEAYGETPLGLTDGAADLRVVFEITERALTEKPADLLHAVSRLRARGFGIALDDVGADRRSLALMPLLRPDVIKLDLRLIQGAPSHEVAEIHNAVSAQAERTGATVLAEGIETDEHATRARAMGATLGQGFMLGRPGPLPPDVATGDAADIVFTPPVPPVGTPFEAVAARRPTHRGDKRLLLAISRELEREVARLGPNAVVLSAFQEYSHFTPPTHDLYAGLAERTAFVGALGLEMGGEPAPGVRGARLEPADPLVAEWAIAVVGPHYAACFAARDLGDEGADLDRRFDFALTHDRDIVILAARSLMARIPPVGAGAPAASAFA
jgi:EAL domain-containing protein (putative c-di-GMP-specific phosphodiesterase class I)